MSIVVLRKIHCGYFPGRGQWGGGILPLCPVDVELTGFVEGEGVFGGVAALRHLCILRSNDDRRVRIILDEEIDREDGRMILWSFRFRNVLRYSFAGNTVLLKSRNEEITYTSVEESGAPSPGGFARLQEQGTGELPERHESQVPANRHRWKDSTDVFQCFLDDTNDFVPDEFDLLTAHPERLDIDHEGLGSLPEPLFEFFGLEGRTLLIIAGRFWCIGHGGEVYYTVSQSRNPLRRALRSGERSFLRASFFI